MNGELTGLPLASVTVALMEAEPPATMALGPVRRTPAAGPACDFTRRGTSSMYQSFASAGNVPAAVVMSTVTAFQVGRGLGEMAGGIVQMVGGGAMTGAGTGLAAGGLVAEGPSLGTSTVVVAGGAALATAGVVVSAHGAVNVAAGANQILNAARGSGDGPPEAKNAPSRGGQEAVARGAEREARVAELVGGKVSREQIRTRFGGSDIDVIGPKGELIAVGSPAKANNLSKLGTQLKVLEEAAAMRGVPAKAAFEKGTPQSAIDLAVKKLGAEDVFVF